MKQQAEFEWSNPYKSEIFRKLSMRKEKKHYQTLLLLQNKVSFRFWWVLRIQIAFALKW